MKDLLYPISITAPVFHAEMSELKADAYWNTAQTKAGRTPSGGRRQRGIEKIKNMVSTTTTTTTNKTIATNERSISR
jgi:hypothetical protein